jgi:hypothetical protein
VASVADSMAPANIVGEWARSMANGTPVFVQGVAVPSGRRDTFHGIINRIEREDGSGRCWNLTFANGTTVFVRIGGVA